MSSHFPSSKQMLQSLSALWFPSAALLALNNAAGGMDDPCPASRTAHGLSCPEPHHRQVRIQSGMLRDHAAPGKPSAAEAVGRHTARDRGRQLRIFPVSFCREPWTCESPGQTLLSLALVQPVGCNKKQKEQCQMLCLLLLWSICNLSSKRELIFWKKTTVNF